MIIYDLQCEINAMCANLRLPRKVVKENYAYFVNLDGYANGAFIYNDALYDASDVREVCEDFEFHEERALAFMEDNCGGESIDERHLSNIYFQL